VATITVASGGGRQVRRKRKARTFAEARTRLKELQEEQRQRLEGSGRMALSAHLDKWLARQQTEGKRSPNTLVNYRWAIDNHLKPVLGPLQLAKVTPDDVDKLLGGMARAGAASNTMMRVRAVLNQVFTDAVRRRVVGWNPVSVTTLPSGPKRMSRAMTPEQVTALLRAAEGDPLEAMWSIGVMLGLRPGELAGLLWADIDLDAEVLHVRRARLHEPDGIRLGEPKTEFSIRAIDMPHAVVEAVRRQRVRQLEKKLAAEVWADLDLVFCDEGGEPLSRWRMASALDVVTQRAGIGGWQVRELRHTAVSLMYDAGLSTEQVSDVVGHAPGSRMTAGTYRHVLTDSLGAAKAAMDRLFKAV
jgi:integrase